MDMYDKLKPLLDKVDAMPIQMGEIVANITCGRVDSELDLIVQAVKLRKLMLGEKATADVVVPQARKTKHDFAIGDTVEFNKNARPAYLQGKRAKVVGKKNVKLSVQMMDGAVGRFSGRPVGCPVEIVDKVVV